MDLIVVVKTFADSNSTEMKMYYKGITLANLIN